MENLDQLESADKDQGTLLVSSRVGLVLFLTEEYIAKEFFKLLLTFASFDILRLLGFAIR